MADDGDDLCILVDLQTDATKTGECLLRDKLQQTKINDVTCILGEDIPEINDVPGVLSVPGVSNGDATGRLTENVPPNHEISSDEFVWADDPVEPDDSCILDGLTNKGKTSKQKLIHKGLDPLTDDSCIILDKTVLLPLPYCSLTNNTGDILTSSEEYQPTINTSNADDDFTNFEVADDTITKEQTTDVNAGFASDVKERGIAIEHKREIDIDQVCILKHRVRKRDLKLAKDGDSKCILGS